jgi:hypothetical protein
MRTIAATMTHSSAMRTVLCQFRAGTAWLVSFAFMPPAGGSELAFGMNGPGSPGAGEPRKKRPALAAPAHPAVTAHRVPAAPIASGTPILEIRFSWDVVIAAAAKTGFLPD